MGARKVAKLNLAKILMKVSKIDRRLLQLLLDLGCFFSIG